LYSKKFFPYTKLVGSIEGSFIPWSRKLHETLLLRHPLPEGISPIPDDEFLLPTYELVKVSSGSCSIEQNTPALVENSPHKINETPPDDLLEVKNSQVASVEFNDRITPASHWQDVRHIGFKMPYTPYEPGDVLTIYPKNFPRDVDHFIELMGWGSVADDALKFTTVAGALSVSKFKDTSYPIQHISGSELYTIRQLLTSHMDIMAIPRRSFFAAIVHFTADEAQRERIIEFTKTEYLDELYDYTTRPRRSILEVLQEFDTVKIPWKWICNILPPLRGRQFSIASGGLLKGDQFCSRVELLVAIVKYRTVIKRIRQGVCTRYIASLQPGQKLSITLHKGGLGLSNDDYQKPVVMIGPGTGIAPMRSLIYERQARKGIVNVISGTQVAQKPSDYLFFGCRNANADYFFKDDWVRMTNAGSLAVYPAFSRDQV
jgi:sulfite reductase alpha subunit-like flavoprotein